MSLPQNYSNSKQYIEKVLTFLKTYEWIFNYPNTHILVEKAIFQVPNEWRDYFAQNSVDALNKFPLGQTKENCPASLIEFLNEIESMKPLHEPPSKECFYNLPHNSQLSRKKFHEIKSFGPVIDDLCKKSDIKNIVNAGSGLGYLSHLLNEKYNYSVVGIEANENFIQKALEMQEKHHPKSKNLVKFHQHFITQNDEHFIEIVKNHFPESDRVCLIGLHACADLSLVLLDLFGNMDLLKLLVIMPCCYHRFKVKEAIDGVEIFHNFPASNVFKEMFGKFEAEKFIKKPFLRLSCQYNANVFCEMSKEQHEVAETNCFFRAIFQCVIEQEQLDIKKIKGKTCPSFAQKHAKDEEALEHYMKFLAETHEITNSSTISINGDQFKQEMRKTFEEFKEHKYLIEVITCFQASIQSICENLVLLDRVECLKEKGFESYVKKISDSSISPRCFAVIAEKK